GTSGIYFSFDSGDHWVQPTYSGYSARVGVGGSCLGQVGPDPGCVPLTPEQGGQIGTLPKYYENGLVSDGDPAVAFGPVPGSDGSFAWSNGARLYYADLPSKLPGAATFKGAEAIGVSRPDDAAAAAAGDNDAWMAPVIASRQASAT